MDDSSSMPPPHPEHTPTFALGTLLSPYSFVYTLPSLRLNPLLGGQDHVLSVFCLQCCHRVDIQSFAEWVGGWMDERNKQIGRKMIPRALSGMPRN